MVKNFLKSLFLLVSITITIISCGGNDLNGITFFSAVAGAFTINADEENRILPGDFIWVEALATDDNNQLLLDTFNLAQSDVESILPETIDLTVIDTDANWRFLRTVQVFMYNSTGDDSLLIARLDTIPTNINEVISLNTNNESIRTFLFQGDFQYKTLLEIRDTVKTVYNFELDGINRVSGGI